MSLLPEKNMLSPPAEIIKPHSQQYQALVTL